MRCLYPCFVVAALGLGVAQADPPAAEAPPGPPPIAWWAQPSITPAYVGYYVGGGCPYYRHGESRHPLEGTWGWDWTGYCFHRKVDLLWWHGRRYQGGTGAYRTDGPRPLERLHEEHEGEMLEPQAPEPGQPALPYASGSATSDSLFRAQR